MANEEEGLEGPLHENFRRLLINFQEAQKKEFACLDATLSQSLLELEHFKDQMMAMDYDHGEGHDMSSHDLSSSAKLLTHNGDTLENTNASSPSGDIIEALLRTQANSMSKRLRSVVEEMLGHTAKCLKFLRLKKKLLVDSNTMEEQPPLLVPQVIFESCTPPQPVLIESIAKHFLHSSRLELFETFTKELCEQHVQCAEDFRTIFAEHPWVTLPTDVDGPCVARETSCGPNGSCSDDLLQDDSPVRRSRSKRESCAVEASIPLASLYSACLVPHPIVLAYKQFHTISKALESRNVDVALEWFNRQPSSKQRKHIHFSFTLRKAKLYNLILSSSPCDTQLMVDWLHLLRNHFQEFLPVFQHDIAKHAGCLAMYPMFLASTRNGEGGVTPSISKLKCFWDYSELHNNGDIPKSEGSQSAELMDSVFLKSFYEQLTKSFQRVFCDGATVVEWLLDAPEPAGCEALGSQNARFDGKYARSTGPHSVVRFPSESPLAVNITAGIACLPQFYRLAQALDSSRIRERLRVWKTTKTLPLDIDLGPCFHFHTKFTCPICRSSNEDLTTRSHLPCRLPCGHMICRACVDRLTVRTRHSTLKCPMCPNQTPSSSVQDLTLL